MHRTHVIGEDAPNASGILSEEEAHACGQEQDHLIFVLLMKSPMLTSKNMYNRHNIGCCWPVCIGMGIQLYMQN